MKVALLVRDLRSLRGAAVPRDAPQIDLPVVPLLLGFAELPGIEVHVICCEREDLPAPEKLAPNVYFHRVIVGRWGWGRTGFLGCARAVRRRAAEIGPDIVHGQGTERDCAISAVLSGYPSVVTLHGNMAVIARRFYHGAWLFHQVVAQLQRYSLRNADAVICISKYSRSLVRNSQVATFSIPNAVHPIFFSDSGRDEGARSLFCPAVVLPLKNQIGLIHALDPMNGHERPNLVFAGPCADTSPYGAEFLRQVSRRPWCSYLGVLGREEVAREIVRSAGVILPSLEENLPVAVLEGLAAGRCVLASNVGGIGDVIRHGENGLLFNPGVPEEIRATVRFVFENPDHARRIAENAGAEARRLFLPREVASRHLDAYRQVLSGKRPR